MFHLDDLKYDNDGLIPAVVQDFFSGEVLMVAYMNAESLKITLEEKRTCFWSRSREELWRKGQTSGNIQRIVSVAADCDADTLLIKVISDGPACHTGNRSCFFNGVYSDPKERTFSLGELYDIIADRKADPKEKSYTNYLFDSGIEKILKKVGEETSEVIIAAMKDDVGETIYEISDLCYHIMVLMVGMGISQADIIKELAGRHRQNPTDRE